MRKALERQYLTLNEAFKSIDTYDRGFLSAYDLQDIIAENRRSCNPNDLGQEVQMLIDLYDKRSPMVTSSTGRGITHWSFIEMLTP